MSKNHDEIYQNLHVKIGYCLWKQTKLKQSYTELNETILQQFACYKQNEINKHNSNRVSQEHMMVNIVILHI